MNTESVTKPTTTKRENLPFQKLFINTIEIPVNQKQIKSTQTRLNVTTWRYLSPNNRARSLSTLMAVDVKIDTSHKIVLETNCKEYPILSL